MRFLVSCVVQNFLSCKNRRKHSSSSSTYSQYTRKARQPQQRAQANDITHRIRWRGEVPNTRKIIPARRTRDRVSSHRPRVGSSSSRSPAADPAPERNHNPLGRLTVCSIASLASRRSDSHTWLRHDSHAPSVKKKSYHVISSSITNLGKEMFKFIVILSRFSQSRASFPLAPSAQALSRTPMHSLRVIISRNTHHLLRHRYYLRPKLSAVVNIRVQRLTLRLI
jgi:hypothetical protein